MPAIESAQSHTRTSLGAARSLAGLPRLPSNALKTEGSDRAVTRLRALFHQRQLGVLRPSGNRKAACRCGMLGFRAAERIDRYIHKDGKLYNALDFKKFYPKDQRSYGGGHRRANEAIRAHLVNAGRKGEVGRRLGLV